jgi:hypothetical protein
MFNYNLSGNGLQISSMKVSMEKMPQLSWKKEQKK